MAQVVAMHVIRRTKEPGKKATGDDPATPPEVETIQPGTLFELEGEELSELRESGAVVAPDDKRAAKFGYGKGGIEVKQEDGESEESAAKRRAAAKAAPKQKTGKKDPLIGEDDELVG